VNEVAEVGAHAAHRRMVVLARDGAVVVGQLPEPLDVVRKDEVRVWGRGRVDLRLQGLLALLLGRDLLNLLNISGLGGLHHLLEGLLAQSTVINAG
jgi:hypothetical protein